MPVRSSVTVARGCAVGPLYVSRECLDAFVGGYSGMEGDSS